jgi:hypothetical protein
MHDIQRIAIPSGSDGCPADISVGNTFYRFTHNTLRLEIYTGMEMIGAQLAEISAQIEWKIERRDKERITTLSKR